MIVDTRAGARIVKLRGAAQGTAPLVAEVIVAELAEAAGLLVPPRSVVEIPAEIEAADWDDELADLLAASAGLNLGFDFLDGARELDAAEVARVEPETRAAILWLDRLVLNPDRTARNPNLLWWSDQLWLIDHGAALGFQYDWGRVSEDSPRQPGLGPEAHLFESVRSTDELLAADATLAPKLTRETVDQAVHAVPDSFLLPLVGDASLVARRRAAYEAYLWQRLRAPRPFLEGRDLPTGRPCGRRPPWLERR